MGVTAWYLTGCASVDSRFDDDPLPPEALQYDPIDRSLANIAPRKFFGDTPDKSHPGVWDKQNYLAAHAAKIPYEKELREVVVIGGGLSGLTTAFLLRDHKPVVLEQAPRFGGNSKGQSWQGIDYSLGASSFAEPEIGTPLHDLLMEDLRISQSLKTPQVSDPYAVRHHLVKDFWKGDSEPGSREVYDKLNDYLEAVWKGSDDDGDEKDDSDDDDDDNENRETPEKTADAKAPDDADDDEVTPYPDMPTNDPKVRAQINELDKFSLLEHLESVCGELPNDLHAAIEYYSWSSFGASAGETSAAAGLNFLAAEWAESNTLVGGNAAVTSRLVRRLNRDLPPNSLRASSTVIDVKVTKDRVKVLYEDARGNFHVIEAKAVVMACPKVVVGQILDDIEPARRAAIGKLTYRPFLVGNVCISHSAPPSFYEMSLIDAQPAADIRAWSKKQKITDVVLANFAKSDNGHSVLTLYRPLPYEGARQEIFQTDAYERIRIETERQVYQSILPLLGLSAKDVVDFRIARWGRALPVARKGIYLNGTLDKVRAPFKDRVFFVEQDNWALPCLESACGEAITWAKVIEEKLKS